eukprot:m.83537 g.83537  ORF g.83537 m.83537 type:complete len:276 (+) comp21129_c0_seq1:104-931(+)
MKERQRKLRRKIFPPLLSQFSFSFSLSLPLPLQNHYTALILAAGSEHPSCPEVVELLLEAGADIEAFLPIFGQNSLLSAVEQGNEKTVEILLNHNANVAYQRPDGRFALYLAATKGFHRVAEILLEHGADPNQTTSDLRTSLHAATTPEVVETLIKHGGLVDVLDAERRTPILFSAQQSFPAQEETMLRLIQYHADISLGNWEEPYQTMVAKLHLRWIRTPWHYRSHSFFLQKCPRARVPLRTVIWATETKRGLFLPPEVWWQLFAFLRIVDYWE